MSEKHIKVKWISLSLFGEKSPAVYDPKFKPLFVCCWSHRLLSSLSQKQSLSLNSRLETQDLVPSSSSLFFHPAQRFLPSSPLPIMFFFSPRIFVLLFWFCFEGEKRKSLSSSLIPLTSLFMLQGRRLSVFLLHGQEGEEEGRKKTDDRRDREWNRDTLTKMLEWKIDSENTSHPLSSHRCSCSCLVLVLPLIVSWMFSAFLPSSFCPFLSWSLYYAV